MCICKVKMSYWARFVFICVTGAVCFKDQLLFWQSQMLLPPGRIGRVGPARLGNGRWTVWREHRGGGCVGKLERSPTWKGLRVTLRNLDLVLQSWELLRVLGNEQDRAGTLLCLAHRWKVSFCDCALTVKCLYLLLNFFSSFLNQMANILFWI